MLKKIKTIGVLAHVDAGKTSLTEAMLYEAGATSHAGSVDKGSTITDGMKMEKERGISIKTATVDFTWKNTLVNIVDTPGHIDFSAEVERALSVLDLVILVISAVEGVQAHTLNLWESIRERRIPAVFFINKIDRNGADPEQIYREIEKDLGVKLFALNYVNGDDPSNHSIQLFQEAEAHLAAYVLDKSLENLADVDEEFLEEYLEGDYSDLHLILNKARNAVDHNSLHSVIFGSAKLNVGVDLLLDEVVRKYSQKNNTDQEISARVFKVEFDKKLGRLAHIRIFNGKLQPKDIAVYPSLEKEIKVNQIYQRKLGKLTQVKELSTGDIGIISTSDLILAGDTIGKNEGQEQYASIVESVISVQAIAKEEKDYHKLGEALEILNIEDPQLDFQWFKEDREFQLKILGPIQTEVLKDSLQNRFGIEAEFQSPRVIYQETPASTGEGYVRYWMPKPCWAIMKFLIEPADRGSGWTFESKVRTSDISQKYQNEIIRAIPWALRQGIKGWLVTDIKITLLEGTEHNVHSNPGDFLLATPMGIMRGIDSANTHLLEPMYGYEIKAHKDHLGSVISDLNQMNATIGSPSFDGDFFHLVGRVSVEQSINYGIKFNTVTSGKGRLKLTLDGYDKTDVSVEKIRSFRGVSPLDESLWILHNRGAFKAEDRVR